MPSPAKLGYAFFAKNILAKYTKSTPVATNGVTAKFTVGGAITETFEFKNASIATIDATTNGAQGSLKLVDIARGNLIFTGITTNLTIARVGTSIIASAAIVSSLGTAPAGVDATLTGTEANLIASTATPLSTGTGAFKARTTSVNVFDGTAAVTPVYLNFAMPDASHGTTNDALLVNGSITVTYINSGFY